MHSSRLFKILAAIAGLTCLSAFEFQTRSPFSGSGGEAVVARKDLVEDVDQRLDSLRQRMRSRAPANVKVQVLRETLSQVQKLRQERPVQRIDREIYLDYSTASLEHVAQDKNFSLEKCAYYQLRLRSDFEPFAEDKPEHPALRRSYDIIQGLCS
ncbi:MAG: hypothetical protein AAGB31_02550 [Bdellovibrio sp.]